MKRKIAKTKIERGGRVRESKKKKNFSTFIARKTDVGKRGQGGGGGSQTGQSQLISV